MLKCNVKWRREGKGDKLEGFVGGEWNWFIALRTKLGAKHLLKIDLDHKILVLPLDHPNKSLPSFWNL